MIGFRINEDFERKGKEYFEEILTMDTCLVSDGMNNFNTMHHSIKPINRLNKKEYKLFKKMIINLNYHN